MVDESTLSEFEKRIVDWLVYNQELKLKDFFLADLSWVQHLNTTRPQTIADFFTKRMGKRVFALLPDDIKNYVIANRL